MNKEFIPVLKRLLSFLFPFTGYTILSILLGFATIGSGIGLMATSAYIISAAALQPSISVLQVPIVAVRFFGTTRGVFRYLERLTSHQVTLRVLNRLRVWFYQNLEPLAPARLMQYRSGDLLSRILADIATLESFYTRVVTPPVVAVLVTLTIVLFIAHYDLSLSLALLVFLLLAGGVLPWFSQIVSNRPSYQLAARRADLNAVLVDGIQGLPDLLAANQEQGQFIQLLKTNQALMEAQAGFAQVVAMQNALGLLLSNFGMWSVLCMAIPLVVAGRLEGVFLAVIVMTTLASFEAVLPLPLAAQYLERGMEAAGRLLEVISAQPEVVDRVQPLPAPQDFGLEVKRLTFKYPSFFEEEIGLALQDISFCLPQGSHMAIVGPSGSGKTTLVNLFLRFWEIQQGEILLGGKDLRGYSQEDIREYIAVITQNTFLFNTSVKENLLLARPNASEEDMIWAAQTAQVHNFIKSLPYGYDTVLGEAGLRLSAGERQRLAIARALLRDAPVLILDEATVNLDAVTERSVLQAINALMRGRTTIMITHHLVGLGKMDTILVLQTGRVVESGSHHQLLQLHGLYRHMWDLQNQILNQE
jgi:ATP-binding cassette subfamily C protein CydC